MFERYTEKARRVIFFGRYEASQFGSPYIETEHLLLGLLREDKALTYRFLRRGPSQVEEIRKQIESASPLREKVSTSADLPVSNECKRVLAYAAEEADRLSHEYVGTAHLLLGLLREEKSFAAQILNERGLRLSSVREEVARSEQREGPAPQPTEAAMLSDFTTFLTMLAKAEELLPCIGREDEIAQVMRVLGRSSKNNAVLVGETGAGKRTIAEGLVQRVANGMGPEFLTDKTFAAVDLATVVTAAQHSARSKEYLAAAGAELLRSGANTIFIFDELYALLAAGPSGGLQEITLLLKSALMEGKVRCIALAAPEEYNAARKNARWLDSCFLAVEIRPPNETQTVAILQGIKERFEKFHSVRYTDESLSAAVTYSSRMVKNRCLPDKAIDLIDDAGAWVKMTHEKVVLPAEVVEAAAKLKFVVRRIENAIANHEFEKARFYSDEEKKQRDLLRTLEDKHNLKGKLTGTVTAEHIEEVLARWTGVQVESVRAAAAAGGGKELKEEKPSRPKKGKKKKSL